MHSAAADFTRAALRLWGEWPTKVVEVGSLDVNGSVRDLFAGAALYTGIDVRDGRGVDEVADGADYVPGYAPDVVLCLEVLEHVSEEKAEAIVANMVHMLEPGGLLVITAAGPDRAPHGVDGGAVGPGETYRAVKVSELERWVEAADPGPGSVAWMDIEVARTWGPDVQLAAIKRTP